MVDAGDSAAGEAGVARAGRGLALTGELVVLGLL